jgi:hypothetical protein
MPAGAAYRTPLLKFVEVNRHYAWHYAWHYEAWRIGRLYGARRDVR